MNKDQFVRYKTLDECFRNVNGTFTIDDLIEECDKALKAYHPGEEQVHVSRRTIEKDLSDLQARYGLVFQKGLTLGHKKIYRYEDTSYSLKKDRIEKLLDADALAIKQRSDERCVAEEAEVQEKRRRIKEHRTLINSEEYLNRVFGTDRQVFDIKFGQVIVSFEKKMIRFMNTTTTFLRFWNIMKKNIQVLGQRGNMNRHKFLYRLYRQSQTQQASLEEPR